MEEVRCSEVIGTENGLVTNCYLGHGFTARLTAGVFPFEAKAHLVWDVTEQIQFSVGLDGLRRAWEWGWAIAP